jgi:hypothetical protein
VCGHHGGLSPQALAAAASRRVEEAAREAVARHHLDDSIDPATALLEEVRRSSGAVKWIRARITALDPDVLICGTRYVRRTEDADGLTTVTEAGPGVHLWWRLYQEERKHLASVSSAALAAGAQERLVRLAEQQGALLADGLTWLLAELGHAGDEEATGKVVTMLRCLDGGLVPGAGGAA